MAYRYEFREAAARDLAKLTRHNSALLLAITVEHIPTILKDPHSAGEAKKGDLTGLRAYNLKVANVAYRLVYEIVADVVRFVATGPHDEAYARAKRR